MAVSSEVSLVIECFTGSWQWPLRGIRIGEASHPGPETTGEFLVEDADVLGDEAYADLERECFGPEIVVAADTDPPSEDSLPFARTQVDMNNLEVDVLQYSPTEAGSREEDFLLSVPMPFEEELPDEQLPSPPVRSPGVQGPSIASLRCPFCDFSTSGPARGLICHLTCRHGGAEINEPERAILSGLDRGICTGTDCGALRPLSSRSCPRCGLSSVPRPIRIGDHIARSVSRAHSEESNSRPTWLNGTLISTEHMKEDFRARVERLPPATIVHIPISLRKRHCRILTRLLRGMADGDEECCLLELARSKLLLSNPPRNMNRRVELARRLQLWEDGKFAELLTRSEEQRRRRIAQAGISRPRCKRSSKARRARMLASEGAYGKAVSSLTADLADLSHEDQRRWGHILLPGSSDPTVALSSHVNLSMRETQGDDERPRKRTLAGVKFKALSAPGPSGARPEHMRELLALRARHISGPLFRALQELIEIAISGQLCSAARWILHSRVVFLRKKSGTTPRPIRVGELWRRVIAKRLIADQRGRIQEFCLRVRQLGVSIPGGADALIHFRTELETALLESGSGELVILDVDLKNAFPSIEWHAIRQGLCQDFPDLMAWTSWCHLTASQIELPSGEILQVDRGAEQGDPLGPLYCAVVLADVMQRVRQRCDETGINFADFWYMDDGQILCKAADADAFLRIFDEEAARAGAQRGRETEAKSVARRISADANASLETWMTDYIRESTVPINSKPPHVLGIDFGGEVTNDQLRAKTKEVEELHNEIALVEDTAAELILVRKCADICKVVHLLRGAGSSISIPRLAEYDALLRRSLERILGGPLDDVAWLQATLGVADGGLGFRRARDIALPAFISSRLQARHLVESLADAVKPVTDVNILSRFDLGLEAAIGELRGSLSIIASAQIQAIIDDARNELSTVRALDDRHGILPGDALILPAGAEDDEHERDRNLQGKLCAVLDAERAAQLQDRLEAAQLHASARRFRELRDRSTSHDWLWALNPCHGPVVPPAEFAVAVRLRIGASCIDDEMICPRCSSSILDRVGAHALCCAIPEATRGHYAVRDDILQLTHLADPSADTETSGLIDDAPLLRPADIFTSAAIPGRLAALDIAVTSPDCSGAGDDCCEAMYEKKKKKYEEFRESLAAQGICYVPLVFSAYGRMHPEAEVILNTLAMRAARRRGIMNHRAILRRVRANIGVSIWKRAANMVMACLPRLSPEEERLLGGEASDDESIE